MRFALVGSLLSVTACSDKAKDSATDAASDTGALDVTFGRYTPT